MFLQFPIVKANCIINRIETFHPSQEYTPSPNELGRVVASPPVSVEPLKQTRTGVKFVWFVRQSVRSSQKTCSISSDSGELRDVRGVVPASTMCFACLQTAVRPGWSGAVHPRP